MGRKRKMMVINQKYFKSLQFILISLLVPLLTGQSSAVLQPWYFVNHNGSDHNILDKELVHAAYGDQINLYAYPFQGAILYEYPSSIKSFIIDPAWNRIVYGVYNQNGDEWLKVYGEWATDNTGFNHPYSITAVGWGKIFVADTYNGRLVEFWANGNSIDASSFTVLGESIFNRPWDLDYDDGADNLFGNDIIWVVDRGLDQVIPLKYDLNSDNIYNMGSIVSLSNPTTGNTYLDLSGIGGVSVRKNGSDSYVNSTAGNRLYLIDTKLRKLFLVDVNSIINGQANVTQEVTFSSDVLLSGVESDFFGDVWVTDNANGKLLKYSWDLEYLDELIGLNHPTSVASVRQHHLNIAITERWTESTGQRTYSQGADIKNLSVSGGFDIANVSLKLTNYSKLVVKMYKGTTLEATLVDNLSDGFINASGTQSLNWLKENANWGNYTAKVWAYSYDDNAVYHYDSYNFSFALEAYLNGPNNLGYRQTGTFTAQSTGGSSSPSFQWYKKYDGSSTWHSLGTNQTQYSTMFNTGFTMKVVVSSGGETSAQTLYCASGSGEGGFNPKVLILPESYSLSQNHPNPFNPVTTIKYEIPEPSAVSFVVYDLLGHEIIRWEKGYEQAGFKQFTWNGKNKYGQIVPAGMYFYKLMATSLESKKVFSENRKMVLLK